MNMTLHLTDALGRKLSVETTLSELDNTMRALNTIGATSGDLLGSGLTLPYDNEKDFDWTLIGARPWTDPEGSVGVFWQGSFYKRREFEAKTSGVKMPAAIKYSRGARPTDPAAIVEGDGDSVRYVSLILFKAGRRQEGWAKKEGRKNTPMPASTAESAPTTPTHMTEANAAALIEHLRQKMPGTELVGLSFRQVIEKALGRTLECPVTSLTVQEGQTVARYMNTLAVAQ